MESLKIQVERGLGHALDESDWRTLDRLGLIDHARATEPNPALVAKILVQKVRVLESARGETIKAEPAERKKERAATNREDALAQIVALEARRSPIVLEFRRRFLRGRLLKRERVPLWLRRVSEREGHTAWITVPLDDEGDPVLDQEAMLIGRDGSERRIDSLRYIDANVEPALYAEVYVRLRGTLWELRKLAGVLGDLWGWHQNAAIRFVLCDHVPVIADVSGHWDTRRTSRLAPALVRLSMTISPRTPARDVVQLYEELRGDPPERSDGVKLWPVRALSETTAERAVFVAEVNDGRTWEEARDEWNRRHPRRGHYSRGPSDFGKDAREAYRAVTGRKLHWLSEPGRRPARA